VKAPTPERTALARFCTGLYFAYFVLMPIWTVMERTKAEPARITMDGGMGFWRALGVAAIVAALVFIPLKAVGSETAHECGEIACDAVDIDHGDKASMQRGAQIFVNYCMGCHGAKFSRWERVADDLGIPHSLMLENLAPGTEKIGNLMTISMPERAAKKWFGAPPPDLTLVTRARSPEWVYTYLRNFYADSTRPFGVNNKVFRDVGMPHALLDLQGLQACAPGPSFTPSGGMRVDPLTSKPLNDAPCGSYSLVTQGKLTPGEFDGAVRDLVNFLSYLANPVAEQSRQIGKGVLLFIALLFVFVWLLNREYWKDVH